MHINENFLNKLKEVIKDFSSVLQAGRVYTLDHSFTVKAVDRLYTKLKDALRQGDVYFGIAGKEIFYKDYVFLDLTESLCGFINFLRNRNIGIVKFNNTVSKQDLLVFFRVLMQSADKDADIAGRIRSSGVNNIIVDRLRGNISSPGVSDQKNSAVDKTNTVLQEIEHTMQVFSSANDEFLSYIAQGNKLNEYFLGWMFSGILEATLANKPVFLMLSDIKEHHNYTFYHCIDVANLVMYQARYLSLSNDLIVKLGIAGFLHDSGKLNIDLNLLDQKQSLSAGEFDIIKSHSLLGSKIILKSLDLPLSVIAAYQHHMGVHLNGYPKSRFIKKQNLAGMLVAVADIYDALRSRRAYKQSISLERVYEIMMKEKGRILHPDLVDLFYHNLGVWPVGTVVRLNSNEVALVIAHNINDIFKPRVKIYYDSRGNRLDGENIVDLTVSQDISIVRQLKPEGEGCDYIKEIFANI